MVRAVSHGLLVVPKIGLKVCQSPAPNPEPNWEFVLRMVDETGKVDINTAEPRTLTALFVAAGCSGDKAAALTRAVTDWRGPTVGGTADDGSPAPGTVVATVKEEGVQL